MGLAMLPICEDTFVDFFYSSWDEEMGKFVYIFEKINDVDQRTVFF